MPVVALRKISDALHALSVVPHSGRSFPDDSPFSGSRYRVVRIRRRWSYQIVYSILDELVWIRLIVPSWLE
ncbi:MAG: hypothetical protein HOV81_09790 [Kofleriaceae bacterium]|nr:hypothetical protein [Kofleriaceae bacterium]